jgi:hypothetical protein
MQTEPPYWLAEAYLKTNERFDTGQVTRSIINAAFLSWLLSAAEAPSFRILDTDVDPVFWSGSFVMWGTMLGV